MTKRLVLVRHGQTDWNVERRIQGQIDVPLNALGHEQAAHAAEQLHKLEPTHIVTSDLTRAVQTATPLALLCDLPIHLDPTLREIYVGTWEGLIVSEAEERFPDEYARWHSGEDFPRGGGETRADTAKRTASGLRKALEAPNSGDTIVAFSHGVSLRVAADLLAAEGLVKLDGPAPSFGNATWLILEVKN